MVVVVVYVWILAHRLLIWAFSLVHYTTATDVVKSAQIGLYGFVYFVGFPVILLQVCEYAVLLPVK